jgi:hypothetical protein
MAINSYAELQQYLTGILTANISESTHNPEEKDAENAPHGTFWNNLTYDQFVNGDVPNVSDPNTGDPMPILVKGDAAGSNIIQALEGTPNSPFDPNTGAFGQMPADGPPYLTAAQIQPISDWINAGCPNGGNEDSGESGSSY